MKRVRWSVVPLMVIVLTLTTAYAAETIIKKMTPEQLAIIVKDMGAPKIQVENETTIFFSLNNIAIMAEIQGEGTDVRLISIIEMEGSQDTKLLRVNNWNKEKRFSKAYVDDDGDIVFEHDVDFEKGITQEQLRQSIRTFSLLAFLFHNG